MEAIVYSAEDVLVVCGCTHVEILDLLFDTGVKFPVAGGSNTDDRGTLQLWGPMSLDGTDWWR